MDEVQSTPSDSRVCESCWNGLFSVAGWQAVLSAKDTPPEVQSSRGYSYTTTWEAVHAAADHCTWCRFLAQPDAKGEVRVRVACEEPSNCTPSGDWKLTVSVSTEHGTSWWQKYYMYTNGGDNAARFVAARERIRDLTTPESYKLALSCVDNCANHHTKCPKPEDDTDLPDRLLDCRDPRNPKLVLTGGQRGRYLTLSYVWGTRQPLMTTTKNIDKYLTEGLDMAQFPQTLQDAVLVTHNLGERYLWIDSMCILQDLDADRARQVGMMRSIYRHSYLTISVPCAELVTQGFLHRDRPQKVPNARIPYRCPDGTIGAVWIAKEVDTDIPDASYWDELEPASYRGWCMQERMLPPRSLVYASDTLKYYCQTETVNIGGALCESSSGMRLPNAVYHPPAPGTSLSDEDRKTNRQAWLSVLFFYTLRTVSHPEDRLVAVSGIVEQFQKVYQDEYLAGIWRKSLLFDLLWRSEAAGGKHTRPERYRAPSWSWAAVDGLVPVRYEEDNPDMVRAEVVRCEVALKEEQVPFGEVAAGWLKLRSPVREVTLEATSVRDKVEGTKMGGITFDAEEERRGPWYVVPIIWSSHPPSVQGLVVTRYGDGQCRRVGYFSGGGGDDMGWLDGAALQEVTLA